MNTEIIHPDSEKGKFVTELLEVIEGDYYNFQEMAGCIVDKLEEYADKFRQPDVIKSVCTCRNAEIEKDSLVPVYCHKCNAYVQTDL